MGLYAVNVAIPLLTLVAARRSPASLILPRTFLVARDGVVLGYRPGSQSWDSPELSEKVLARLRNAAALAR